MIECNVCLQQEEKYNREMCTVMMPAVPQVGDVLCIESIDYLVVKCTWYLSAELSYVDLLVDYA